MRVNIDRGRVFSPYQNTRNSYYDFCLIKEYDDLIKLIVPVVTFQANNLKLFGKHPNFKRIIFITLSALTVSDVFVYEATAPG